MLNLQEPSVFNFACLAPPARPFKEYSSSVQVGKTYKAFLSKMDALRDEN